MFLLSGTVAQKKLHPLCLEDEPARVTTSFRLRLTAQTSVSTMMIAKTDPVYSKSESSSRNIYSAAITGGPVAA